MFEIAAMADPSCLSLAIPKVSTTGDFSCPWLSSSAHLTPPYSPSKSLCSSSPVRRCSEDKDIPAVVGLLAIAPPNRATKFPPAPACCKLHEDSNDRPRDSEGSIIHDGCVGSVTVHRHELIPEWAVGMTGRELEIRLQIAEIQKLYRDHQKELYQMSRTRRSSGKTPRKMDQLSAKPLRSRRTSGNDRRHTLPEIEEERPLPLDEKRLSVPEITVFAAVEEEDEEKEEVEEHADESVEEETAPIKEQTSPNDTFEPIMTPEEEEKEVPLPCETQPPMENEEIPTETSEEVIEDIDKVVVDPTLGLEEEQAEEEILVVTEPTDAPVTVEPDRPISSATLTAEALVSGTRVIILEGGLFYSGTLAVVDLDALIFQVQMDGQRSTRPYILCQEDLLLNALRELRLNDDSTIEPGLRVCAVWSGQLQALYPGTVTGFAEETDKTGRRLISIEFDDGDCGNIRLDDIRLLPADFPITKTKTPVLPEFITRKRSTRERSSTILDRSSQKPAAKRRHTMEVANNNDSVVDPVARKWQWTGEAHSDNRLRRTLFSAVQCDGVQVNVGDLVHMLEPVGGRRKSHKDDERYVAVVERFWETRSGAKKLRVAWCYRAHEIVPRVHVDPLIAKRALFRSDHTDDNCIQSLSEKCELLSWTEFKKFVDADGCIAGPNVYFVAGRYDPVKCQLDWADDCADLCAANSK